MNTRKKPDWLKIQLPKDVNYSLVNDVIKKHKLHTICVSGKCPNMGECWDAGTATLMILGNICTRSCKFCAVSTGRPLAPDAQEPENVAKSVQLLQLKHVVLTSVDRDDLPDGGAQHWADTITAIKNQNPDTTIETLIPDFDGNTQHIDMVIAAAPNIISHNLETVERLTKTIRNRARYERSLAVLKHISQSGIVSKSGLMVGLGETYDEIIQTMQHLRANGVQILTIGQYLQPTKNHIEVSEYVNPDIFASYKQEGLLMGFRVVESNPLVRSSYHAEKHV